LHKAAKSHWQRKERGKREKTAATATISLFSSSVCQAARPTTNNLTTLRVPHATCGDPIAREIRLA